MGTHKNIDVYVPLGSSMSWQLADSLFRLFKWLNRRGQRLSYNWAGFKDLLKQFLIPAPKITENYPSKQLKLFV